ncbi:subtilisin-like protease SBT3.11 [Euphorbia lathyris]|uniref:subtilisin-like protease SBT3.11 n=1 Tax=Euphorbia lathyris TaxID=212925 RepID=UPI0033140CB2
MRRTQFSSLSSLISLLLLIFLSKMAESVPVNPPADSSSAAVHIVYTERPTDEEPEAYHLRTLSSLLGSDEAAKDALVYSYKTAASGFSAKLTPEQVERLSREPGVLQVVPSMTYQLHPAKPGVGRIH